jgi:hypothetical protein
MDSWFGFPDLCLISGSEIGVPTRIRTLGRGLLQFLLTPNHQKSWKNRYFRDQKFPAILQALWNQNWNRYFGALLGRLRKISIEKFHKTTSKRCPLKSKILYYYLPNWSKFIDFEGFWRSDTDFEKFVEFRSQPSLRPRVRIRVGTPISLPEIRHKSRNPNHQSIGPQIYA